MASFVGWKKAQSGMRTTSRAHARLAHVLNHRRAPEGDRDAESELSASFAHIVRVVEDRAGHAKCNKGIHKRWERRGGVRGCGSVKRSTLRA